MLYCAAYLHVWMYVDSVIPESTDFSTLRWISERPRKWLARHSSTSSPDSGCRKKKEMQEVKDAIIFNPRSQKLIYGDESISLQLLLRICFPPPSL